MNDQPQKPKRKRDAPRSVRIPRDVREKIERAAERSRTNVNAWIVSVLAAAVESV